MSKASDWAQHAVEQGMMWAAKHGTQRAEVTPAGDLRLWGLSDYHPEDALGLADFVYAMFLESPPSDDVPF